MKYAVKKRPPMVAAATDAMTRYPKVSMLGRPMTRANLKVCKGSQHDSSPAETTIFVSTVND